MVVHHRSNDGMVMYHRWSLCVSNQSINLQFRLVHHQIDFPQGATSPLKIILPFEHLVELLEMWAIVWPFMQCPCRLFHIGHIPALLIWVLAIWHRPSCIMAFLCMFFISMLTMLLTSFLASLQLWEVTHGGAGGKREGFAAQEEQKKSIHSAEIRARLGKVKTYQKQHNNKQVPLKGWS